jgi:cytochrome c biogenesis protein CcdA
MLRVLVLVISIALADALNPGTVVPALYFATTEDGRRRVAAFAAAFFAVNLVGGVILVLGPGQLLLDAISHPSETAKFTVEVVAGGILLVIGAVLLARGPRGAAEPESALVPPGGRGAGALGATIAALELPTALPYFAAIAAIVGSGVGLVSQLVLVGVFNVVFISPVLAILIALSVAGPGIEPKLRRIGERLRTGWRRAGGWLALVAGVLLLGFGATGLAGLR